MVAKILLEFHPLPPSKTPFEGISAQIEGDTLTIPSIWDEFLATVEREMPGVLAIPPKRIVIELSPPDLTLAEQALNN